MVLNAVVLGADPARRWPAGRRPDRHRARGAAARPPGRRGRRLPRRCARVPGLPAGACHRPSRHPGRPPPGRHPSHRRARDLAARTEPAGHARRRPACVRHRPPRSAAHATADHLRERRRHTPARRRPHRRPQRGGDAGGRRVGGRRGGRHRARLRGGGLDPRRPRRSDARGAGDRRQRGPSEPCDHDRRRYGHVRLRHRRGERGERLVARPDRDTGPTRSDARLQRDRRPGHPARLPRRLGAAGRGALRRRDRGPGPPARPLAPPREGRGSATSRRWR